MSLTNRKVLFIVYIVSVLQIQAFESDSILIRFDSRFRLLDSIIHHPLHTTPSLYASGSTSVYRVSNHRNPPVDSIIQNKVDAQIKAMKNVTGLSVTGQIYGRLDDGFGLDEEDALSRYKGKIQADIRWNFLQSSILKRKRAIDEIRLHGNIEKLEHKREDIGQLVNKQKELFQIRYDSLLSGVLIHRITNLSLLSQTQSYLLRQGNISSDELLTILNEKAEAERLLATISHPCSACNNLSFSTATIISVDTVRLISFISKFNTETNTLALRKQLLDNQIAATKYWSTLNCSPFLRYSYYMRPCASHSSNIDAGMSFIIPVSRETEKKRKVLKTERELLIYETDRLLAQIQDNIRLTLMDIERMNRSIEGELKRLSELKNYLKLRLEAYNNRIGEYNYLARMKEYNTYLLCCERLLSFSFQRDCMLASLQIYLPDISILDFCTETELNFELQ